MFFLTRDIFYFYFSFFIFLVNTNSLEVSVQIPENVEIGGSATLVCIFNCDISDIFSVKWYRGSLEFYRYMPKEMPPIKVFPFIVGGIEVDVSITNHFLILA